MSKWSAVVGRFLGLGAKVFGPESKIFGVIMDFSPKSS